MKKGDSGHKLSRKTSACRIPVERSYRISFGGRRDVTYVRLKLRGKTKYPKK